MPDTYQPIDCDLYDYIEAACVFHYMLEIKRVAAQPVTGQALTTRVTKGDGEFIELDVQGESVEIRLDTVISIKPLDTGAQFGLITFRTDD